MVDLTNTFFYSALDFNISIVKRGSIYLSFTIYLQIIGISGLIHQAVEIDGPTPREENLTSFTLLRKLDNVPFPYDFAAAVKKSRVS